MVILSYGFCLSIFFRPNKKVRVFHWLSKDKQKLLVFRVTNTLLFQTHTLCRSLAHLLALSVCCALCLSRTSAVLWRGNVAAICAAVCLSGCCRLIQAGCFAQFPRVLSCTRFLRRTKIQSCISSIINPPLGLSRY